MTIALKLDTSTGRLSQFAASDPLNIDTIEPRSGGNLVIAATLGAADELRLGVSGETVRVMGDAVVDENLTVTGDLTVLGTTTSVDTQNVLVADNHLYLNAGYETASAQSGGLVVNYLPIATTDTVNGAYVAGVAATSNPTVTTTGSATFAVGQFIQINGSTENDGLYEVLSHSGTTLTIRGVGTTATVEDFTQNQFRAGASDGASISRVTLSILRAGTDGAWETASGATTGLTFTDLGSGGGNSLQQAYVQGNTIAVTSAEGVVGLSNSADATDVLQVSRTFVGGGDAVAVSMGAGNEAVTGRGVAITSGTGATGAMFFVNNLGSGNALQVQDGGSDVAVVSAAGAVTLTPTSGENLVMTVAGAGVIDMNAAGAITLDSTGAGVSLDAAGASNFSTSSGNLTLDAAAGELVLDDTGSAGLTLSQSSDRSLDQTASTEVLNGATSLVGAINRLARAMDTGGQAGILEAPIENGVTMAAGDVVAQSTTSGRVTQNNANADTNARAIGTCIVGGTGDVGGTVLARVALPGNFVSDSGASFTTGQALFAPDGTGRPTATAPSGTGDVVQRVGWAHSSTEYVLDFGPAVIL